MRGYNLSSRPKGIRAYSADKLADDITGLVRELGYESATLVGHDWGAGRLDGRPRCETVFKRDGRSAQNAFAAASHSRSRCAMSSARSSALPPSSISRSDGSARR